jgi:hypothetical protein
MKAKLTDLTMGEHNDDVQIQINEKQQTIGIKTNGRRSKRGDYDEEEKV